LDGSILLGWEHVNTSQVVFETGNWIPGIYFVRAKAGKKMYSLRFIVPAFNR
jgi:hypothetical protein